MTSEKIAELKEAFGDDLRILGHHYMAEEVAEHCDLMGDSLELARRVEDITAKYIVFCGVYFMAESAALLARPGQEVHIASADADCVMARMTPAPLLEIVLERLLESGRRIVPLAYVNTSLAVKAVVGRFGGAVCTSSNARGMLERALGQGDAVLFLPDRHLARNTAKSLGLTEADRHTLNIRRGGAALDLEAAGRARLLLWPGCCAVHARFTPEIAEAARRAHPQCRIAVHPECAPDMVQVADAAGSTSFLIDYTAAMPAGSTLLVGTELSLVERLARRHAGRCTILPLARSLCSNMAKTTAPVLLRCLEDLRAGAAAPVALVPEHVEPARASLVRMLEQCA